jgi:hypothetical protein
LENRWIPASFGGTSVALQGARCYTKAAIDEDIAPMPPASQPNSRQAVGAIIAVFGAALLTACNSTGQSAAPKGVIVVGNDEIPMEMFLSQGYCPPVQIRAGTEAMIVYETGQEERPEFIRYQGSVSETARECRVLGPRTLSIRVGIKGRLTAGPKGGPGSATLPLRVAVIKQEGSTVLFSQAVNVQVTVAAPTYSADFAHVVENVTLELGPDDRDLIVYVGFDTGPPVPPTG